MDHSRSDLTVGDSCDLASIHLRYTGIDVKTAPGDIVFALVLNAYQNMVGEPVQVRTRAEADTLRDRHEIASDRVRFTAEARKILAAAS